MSSYSGNVEFRALDSDAFRPPAHVTIRFAEDGLTVVVRRGRKSDDETAPAGVGDHSPQVAVVELATEVVAQPATKRTLCGRNALAEITARRTRSCFAMRFFRTGFAANSINLMSARIES